VDIILAVPRPLRLERLLPVLSCLGVHRVFLVGAEKVERAFFGSHLLRAPPPPLLRRCLLEGLAQAEVDCRLPKVSVHRDLKAFLLSLDSSLGEESGGGGGPPLYRVIAHPPLNQTEKTSGDRFFGIMNKLKSAQALASSSSATQSRIVIAIGE
jgi:16S rRNA U1498 N3-methylase RsmE